MLADEPFDGAEFADRLDLIRRNCRALIVATIADHPKRFSRRFRRHLARHWPLSFRAQRRLRRRAVVRWSDLQSRVDIQTRIAEFLDGDSPDELKACDQRARSL